ncbi:MAG: M23 family metallopeptidase, partial [Polyangiaceae bacterium]
SQSQAIDVNLLQYGRYCSMKPTSGDLWPFFAVTTVDPCASLRQSFPGATILHAGYYSASGRNNVVVMCNNRTFVKAYTGLGRAPITLADNDIIDNGLKRCEINIAPDNWPIFSAPFTNTEANISARQISTSGFFDHAYSPIDPALWGGVPRTPGTLAEVVSWEGQDVTGLRADNALSSQWSMLASTPVLAVAAGTVVRSQSITLPRCQTPLQEIWVRHTLGTGDYQETFITYYGRLSRRDVATGATITKGQQLGLSGSSGCAATPHLHFEVTRLSNLATTYRIGTFNPDTDLITSGMIDPFGWDANGVDPWAYRFIGSSIQGRPVGALSIRLWDRILPQDPR